MTGTGTPNLTIAVQAHPDDTDISSGGSVARWCRDGQRVVYVTCTSGEAGESNPRISPAELGKRREQEERAAAAELGVSEVLFLRHADGALLQTPALEVELFNLILEYRPRRFVTHDFASRHEHHPDHLNAGRAAVAAVAHAGRAGHRITEVLLYRSSEPDAAVDITETIERKLAAIEQHRTQRSMGEAPPEAVKQWAIDTGERWGLPMAEAYRTITFEQCLDLARITP